MSKSSSIAKQATGVTPPTPTPTTAAPMEGLREGVTIETLAYAAILVLAAALRLIHLSAAPLTTSEASQALAAFNSTPMPTGGSPLLYAINQLVFGITGTSLGDAGARLAAALMGTLAVLLPSLYRRSIGRLGALAAALILAISPTLVFASRLMDGQALAAMLALAALGFGLRYGETRRPRDLRIAAISIGLALISGPGALTALIAIGLGSIMAYRWLMSDDDRARLRELGQESAALREALIWGAATVLLVASTLLLNLGGLRGVPEVVSAWLGAWTAFDVIGPLQIFQILLIYEPLIILAGVAGLVIAMRRITGVMAVLGVWGIVALLIAIAQPGRQVTDLALALVPLALLAGLATQRLIDALADRGTWGNEGALWLVGTPLIGYLAITLSSYATGHNLIGNAQLLGQTLSPLGSFAVLLAILALIVGGIFALAMGLGAVLRAGASLALVVLVLLSVGGTWSATQLHAGDPHELLWGPSTTTPEVQPLLEAVEAASWRATGTPRQAAINVALPNFDPVIAWYLRGFKNTRFTAAADTDTPIAITPLGTEPLAEPGAYLGAKFVTRALWSPSALDDAALLRWWVYRQANDPTAEQTLVVWVKPAP